MTIDDDEARVVLDDRARRSRVTCSPRYLAAPEADALFEALYCDSGFAPETVVLFGQAHTTRRLSTAWGEPGTRYRYSGLERAARPWHPRLVPLVARLRASLGARFDFALCNLYPDGRAGLGWHADDERGLAAGAPIASVSLGATRDFALRLRSGGAAVATVPLGHGDLLVMEGDTQRHYHHRVPERARITTPRINLTFRVMAP